MQVANSLKDAWIDDYISLTVIVHTGREDIRSIVESKNFKNCQILLMERRQFDSTERAINSNVYTGLSKTFENPLIDFVTVLEDDIVVRSDFLNFNHQVIINESTNKNFKGINGFSGAVHQSQHDSEYGRFTYGFGWGWTITRRTWNELQQIWKGTEDAHWDAQIEPFVRKGYVVMPRNSRIRNIGDDILASHTSPTDPAFTKLLLSYGSDKQHIKVSDFRLARFALNWRKDALPFVSTSTLIGRTLANLNRISASLAYWNESTLNNEFIVAKGRGIINRITRGLVRFHCFINWDDSNSSI